MIQNILLETLNICILTRTVVLATEKSNPNITFFELKFLCFLKYCAQILLEIKIFTYQLWWCLKKQKSDCNGSTFKLKSVCFWIKWVQNLEQIKIRDKLYVTFFFPYSDVNVCFLCNTWEKMIKLYFSYLNYLFVGE